MERRRARADLAAHAAGRAGTDAPASKVTICASAATKPTGGPGGCPSRQSTALLAKFSTGQYDRLARAYRAAGADAVAGFFRVMESLAEAGDLDKTVG